jgi:hypothetical protein
MLALTLATASPKAEAQATAPAAPPAPKGRGLPESAFGTLTGVVRDLTGAAIARAVVTATGVPRGAETDSLGRFVLAGLPLGDREIRVQRVGFEPLGFTVRIPEPGTLEVQLSLEPTTAGPAAAKSTSIFGTVRDAQGTALAEVEVSALDTQQSVTTDTSGSFRLSDAPRGPHLLRVRKLGYVPRTIPVQVGDSSVAVNIALQPQGVALAATTVTATKGRENFHLPAYYARKAKETGSFIEQEEIERRRPAQLTDLFRSNTTLTVQRDRTGRQWVETRLGGQRRCVPILFVDGVYYRQEPGLIDGMAPPDQVRAVEVYYGRGTIPSEFFRPGSECGVVAVWTK